MAELFTLENLANLGVLIFLQAVLGFDNLLYISLESKRVAADKRDDGIIQNNRLGRKERGYLTPNYSVPTTGGAITSW